MSFEYICLMQLEQFIEYCVTKPGVEETFPFDQNTLVMKVMGKMWAATNIEDHPFRINLKCDPERAVELRDEHEEIIPGWHMNKKHWNTVIAGEGMLQQSLILELIDHSYDLVVSGLTKAKKAELKKLSEII